MIFSEQAIRETALPDRRWRLSIVHAETGAEFTADYNAETVPRAMAVMALRRLVERENEASSAGIAP